MKIVYLASPLGFSEAGRLFMHSKMIPALKEAGITAIEDPWALTPKEEVAQVEGIGSADQRCLAWKELNRRIGKRNADAIDRSDTMVAVLDGVDVDSGTAAEIGYAFGRGLTIYGYRGDFRLAGDNEGAIVNLQVEHFIYESGGTIATTLDELINVLKNVLDN